jgi:hypothetical protein
LGKNQGLKKGLADKNYRLPSFSLAPTYFLMYTKHLVNSFSLLSISDSPMACLKFVKGEIPTELK